jgi:hypothetical protein
MRSFTASDWIEIPGRGKMAVISALPEGDDVYDPGTFKGWRVMIDGKQYDVTGVEVSLGYVPTPARPYRHGFGLQVRPVITTRP